MCRKVFTDMLSGTVGWIRGSKVILSINKTLRMYLEFKIRNKYLKTIHISLVKIDKYLFCSSLYLKQQQNNSFLLIEFIYILKIIYMENITYEPLIV